MRTPTHQGAWTGWRKSSHSGDGGECVEARIAHGSDGTSQVAVRDSKDPHGPQLHLTAQAWNNLIEAIKKGQFQTANS